MLYDAINKGFFSADNEEREASQQAIISFRDTEQNQYIIELINIISLEMDTSNEEQKQLHYRVQNAAIILLYQVVLSTPFLESSSFSLEFFEQLWTLLLSKIESENDKISHSAAVFYGESLGALIRTGYYPQLINSYLEILQKTISEGAIGKAQKLLLALKWLANSSSLEKMSDVVILLFQALFQLLQIPQLLNESIECVISLAHDISIVFGKNYHPDGTSTEEQFVALFITFLNYFFECLSQAESDNRENFYKGWRIFFKNLPISIVNEYLEKVLLITISDIATSENDLILLSAINLVKTCFKRSKKLGFMTVSYFDALLMPLIRVYSMINLDEYQTNLDSGDVIEYFGPSFAARQLLGDLSEIYEEHASSVFTPLIMHYTSFLSGNDAPNPTDIYPISDPNISALVALFLLEKLIKHSTNLPPIDFVVSLFQACLSSPSTNVRFFAVVSIKSYLKRELNLSDEVTDQMTEDETILKQKEEISIINQKLISLFPELINHISDHPDIINYVLKCIRYYAFLNEIHDFVDFNTVVFPVFFELIYNCEDFRVIITVFDVFEEIIKHFDMSYVVPLLEPSIELLANSIQRFELNQSPEAAEFDDKARSLLYTIIRHVTLEALPYHEAIYPLLSNAIETSSLVFLCNYNVLFSTDFPDLYNDTAQKIIKTLNDYLNSESYDENDDDQIVFYLCICLNILCFDDLFENYALQASTLMLAVFEKKSAAKMTALKVLASLSKKFETIMTPVFPSLLSIISEICFQQIIENARQIEDDYDADVNEIIVHCIMIVQSCYNVANQDQNVIQFVVHILEMVQSLSDRDIEVMAETFTLLDSLEQHLLISINESEMISNFIEEYEDEEVFEEIIKNLQIKLASSADIPEEQAEKGLNPD